ncbi:hypothetical protein H4582DRAFT_2060082 [Lactarius indigo]|nr:hypothetical protein H4582DRAFT_2060082 [Lactarius indigo]
MKAVAERRRATTSEDDGGDVALDEKDIIISHHTTTVYSPFVHLVFRLAFALVATASTASTSTNSAHFTPNLRYSWRFWGALTRQGTIKFPVARSEFCTVWGEFSSALLVGLAEWVADTKGAELDQYDPLIYPSVSETFWVLSNTIAVTHLA